MKILSAFDPCCRCFDPCLSTCFQLLLIWIQYIMNFQTILYLPTNLLTVTSDKVISSKMEPLYYYNEMENCILSCKMMSTAGTMNGHFLDNKPPSLVYIVLTQWALDHAFKFVSKSFQKRYTVYLRDTYKIYDLRLYQGTLSIKSKYASYPEIGEITNLN